MRTKLLITLGVTAAIAGSCVQSSTVLDPNHCNSNGGDSFCAEAYPDGSRPYCWLGTEECNPGVSSEHDGCFEMRPVDDACWSACGEGGSVVDDPECEGVADTTMTSTTGTETMSSDTPPTSSGMTADPTTDEATATETTESDTTEGPGCSGDGDCMDGGTPFCSPAGTCVACTEMPEPDAACEGADAATPVCNEGACVQCTEGNASACTGQTPICAGDNTCQPCTEHSHCPDSACHLDGDEVGACFDEADVEMASTTAQLQAAFAGAAADDDVVVVLTGTSYASTSIDFVTNAEVAVLGDGSQDISGNTSGGIIGLGGSAIVYLAGVAVAGNISGDGISCSGTAIWLDDSEVRNNAQVGIDVSGGCRAHLRRTVVRANSVGGVDVSGSTTWLGLVNALVADNVGASAGPGVRVTSSEVAIVYSVLAGNGSFATAANIECLSGATGSARNGIVVGPDGNSIVTCGGLTWENNAVDTSALGASNENVGPLNASWFVAPGSGNYHLSASGEATFTDIAMWADSDPLADVDGDPIPTDMPSFPGYDQPQ